MPLSVYQALIDPHEFIDGPCEAEESVDNTA